jgi:multiple sugar transport system ATP-binding protein
VAEISLARVSKVYGDGTLAVNELDLEIADGEFVVLVGPSGCGKTSALRMVAGLEEVSAGTISIGGRVVNNLLPKDRDIAMVFQNYALYPHMSVYDNMAFGLRHHRVPKAVIETRVTAAARTLGLEDQLAKKPRTLSGGQRQRVAMGRAIVREPRAFLMDEPLSNLDAKLRVEMRAEILRLQRDLAVTTIYVTHDQTEAMTMGDRVAVLWKGVLQQADAPQRLYEHPANLFVAEFIGSPAMNLVEARLERGSEGEGLVACFGSWRLPVGAALAAAAPELERFLDRPLILGFRPEDLEDMAVSRVQDEACTLSIVTDIREDVGSEVYIHFDLGVPPVRRAEVVEALDPGEDTGLPPARSASPFVARLARGTRAQEGEPLLLSVDTERLYFFDPDSGAGLGGR